MCPLNIYYDSILEVMMLEFYVVKARSTRLGWNFFDKNLPIVVAGLLRSWWSFDESVRLTPVKRVTSTRQGLYLLGLAHVGHRLLLQSQKVTIWTLEDRPTQGGSRSRHVLYTCRLRRQFFWCLFPGGFCWYLIVYSYLWSQDSTVMVAALS